MKSGRDFYCIKQTAIWSADLPNLVWPTQASIQVGSGTCKVPWEEHQCVHMCAWWGKGGARMVSRIGLSWNPARAL